MKFRLLLLSFLVCTIASRGQSVWSKPLPPDPSIWTVDMSSMPAPQGCGLNGGTYCGSYRNLMSGDTTIGANNYKKLYGTNRLIYYYNGVSGNYTGDSVYHYYLGALRQDTIGMKSYLCLPGKTTDTLLYSYHLQVGDTVPVSFICKPASSGVTFIVRKIDTILVGSMHYRRFCVGAPNNPTEPSLIQGIGSTDGILTSLYIFFEAGESLSCFNRNSVGFSYANECTASVVTGITEKMPPAFGISSNPSDGLFVIHLNSRFTDLPCSVYALDGRKVFDAKLTGTDIPVDIRQEAPGMYFLQIHTAELNWSVKLLVK